MLLIQREILVLMLVKQKQNFAWLSITMEANKKMVVIGYNSYLIFYGKEICKFNVCNKNVNF